MGKSLVSCFFLRHSVFSLGAHLPALGREPVGGLTTKVCGAWPVRPTVTFPAGRMVSLTLDRYQIILLDDRGTQAHCVRTVFAGWLRRTLNTNQYHNKGDIPGANVLSRVQARNAV